MSVIEPGPPHLPVSFSRTISDASSALENQYGINSAASFDGRNQSFTSAGAPRANISMYGPPHPQASHGAVLNSANFRNFSNVNGHIPQFINHQPQIYTVWFLISLERIVSIRDFDDNIPYRLSTPVFQCTRWK